MPAPRHDDRGQVLPLVALVMIFAALVALGAARLGAEATLSAQAQAAADAAALAGAAAGRASAVRIAAANGARLVAYEADGAEVEVVIERRGAQAAARARRGGWPKPPRVGSRTL